MSENTATPKPTKPKTLLEEFNGAFVCADCGSIETLLTGDLPAGWTLLGNYREVVCSDGCRTKRLRYHAQRQDPGWKPPDAAAVAETRAGADQIDQKDMDVTSVADVVRGFVQHASTSAERWLDKQLEKISGGDEK